MRNIEADSDRHDPACNREVFCLRKSAEKYMHAYMQLYTVERLTEINVKNHETYFITKM